MTDAMKLPRLPQAAVDEHNLQGGRLFYTADQIRAYALASLAAQGDGGRDAARYRWLRDEAVWRGEPDGTGDMVWCVIGPDAYNLTPVDGKDLDELVDRRLAAMSHKTPGEGAR
jgi:hypothetical protein